MSLKMRLVPALLILAGLSTGCGEGTNAVTVKEAAEAVAPPNPNKPKLKIKNQPHLMIYTLPITR
jgi:hypothetical protein